MNYAEVIRGEQFLFLGVEDERGHPGIMPFEGLLSIFLQFPQMNQLVLSASCNPMSVGTELGPKQLPTVLQFAGRPGLGHVDRSNAHSMTSLMGSQSSWAMASFWPL